MSARRWMAAPALAAALVAGVAGGRLGATSAVVRSCPAPAAAGSGFDGGAAGLGAGGGGGGSWGPGPTAPPGPTGPCGNGPATLARG